jgi:integrase
MTPAREFGPLGLKAIRQEFMKADLSRGEINKRTARTVRMFKWAASEELVEASVYQALRTVEGLRRGRGDVRETAPVKPVPDDLVDAIQPRVSRQIWAMIELQRHTGMRPGEVCMMRTGDLVTTGKTWEYRPRRHKATHHGKQRVIFLGPLAQAVVKPWLRSELEAYIFQPVEAEAERRERKRAARKSRVQPSQRNRRKARPQWKPGDRFNTIAYHRAISRGCDLAFPHPDRPVRQENERRVDFLARVRNWHQEHKAELRDWRKAHRFHPHQLRHSAATRLRREFGLDVARAVLGHSSPAVTELYAELDNAKAAAAMERIG